MQSSAAFSILPESIDNIDILEDPLDDASMTLMDLVVDSSNQLHQQLQQQLGRAHRNLIVSVEAGGNDERQRYHALENSYNHHNSSYLNNDLPEPEGKVRRPNLGIMRSMRSFEDPSPIKHKLPEQPSRPRAHTQSPPPTTSTMTLIAATRHANFAAAASADSGKSNDFMSSGDLFECCKEFELFCSNNSSNETEINNNNKNNANTSCVLNKYSTTYTTTTSDEMLFSTGEMATLSLVEKHSTRTPVPPPPLQQQHEYQQPEMPMSSSSNNIREQQPYDGEQDASNNLYFGFMSEEMQILQNALLDEQPQEGLDEDDAEYADQVEDAVVVVPTQFDVKCGRGGDTIQHNSHFIDMCEAMAEAYSLTNRRGMDGKQGIVMSIVHAVQSRQGRFIKQATHDAQQQWQVLPLQGAIDKTSHCIRDILKRRRNEQQQQQTY